MFQVDIAEIVVHEADKANALVDFFDANFLASEYSRDVDLLAVHADAAARGDEAFAVVQQPSRPRLRAAPMVPRSRVTWGGRGLRLSVGGFCFSMQFHQMLMRLLR